MTDIFWLIVIAQALICGGFCSYIADQKNRSVPTWLMLGILFGIFSLIAIVAVPRLAINYKEFSTGERSCPYCGAANRYSAIKCFDCRKDI